MRGTKRERSPGRWELRVYVGRHPISGNPRQISRSFEGSAKQADKALRDFIINVENGQLDAKPVTNPAHTVAVLFGRFASMSDVRESTLASYASFMNRHALPLFGHLEVGEVTTAGLNEFYRYLREVEELSPTTIRRGHACLSSIFNFGISEGFGGLKPSDNPTRGAHLPRAIHEQIIPPSQAQVLRILDPMLNYDPRFLLACQLAVATGARRGELCGLRWFDLSGNRQLHIARGVWDPGGGKPMVIQAPKSGKDRTFALDEDIWNLLSDIQRDDPTLSPRDYILSGGPEPLSPEILTFEFGRLCRRLGIERVRFHDLRHFHATELLRSGEVSIAEVSRRLGHSKTSITLDIYAHAIPADDHHAAAVIRRIMRPSLAPTEPVPIIPHVAGGDGPGR